VSAGHDLDLPFVFVEGIPTAVRQRGENALYWLTSAHTISTNTPSDAPDRDLADANLQAATREAERAHALLKEFQMEAE
jgi:hypothetical protein